MINRNLNLIFLQMKVAICVFIFFLFCKHDSMAQEGGGFEAGGFEAGGFEAGGFEAGGFEAGGAEASSIGGYSSIAGSTGYNANQGRPLFDLSFLFGGGNRNRYNTPRRRYYGYQRRKPLHEQILDFLFNK